MSEVQSRPTPSRGRGSGRGGRSGRGGFSSRGGGRNGGARTSFTNGEGKYHDPVDSAMPSLEDEGDIGQLKAKYGDKIAVIKEMFPDWSEVDILYALSETDGDESEAVTRIADGTISQWGEVSKQKKDRARTKTKPDAFPATNTDSTRPARGGRPDGVRGGRGRAFDRGRGGTFRGKSGHAQTNGTRSNNKDNQLFQAFNDQWGSGDHEKAAENTTGGWGESTWENSAADMSATNNAAAAWGENVSKPAAAPTTSAPPTKPSTALDIGAPKTWASMLRQSTAPKPAPKPTESLAPKVFEPAIEPLPPAEPAVADSELEPSASEDTEAFLEPAKAPVPTLPVEQAVVVPEFTLPPPKDRLTEDNLEQLPDQGNALSLTETLKSEAASSYDPRAALPSATATPLSASQQHHQAQTQRTPVTGFATTAIKATERTVPRVPSYQRRVLDQEEAVRMPGLNRDQVVAAAVQFGAFSLNDEDIDGDREEPETRAQPPDDSPVAQPRASLPPAQPASVPDVFSAVPKPAVALPPNIPTGPAASHAVVNSGPPPNAPTGPSAASQPSNIAHAPASAQAPTQPAQFGRFGQALPQEPAATFDSQPSKPYDSFGQQQQQQQQQPQPVASSAPQSQFESNFASQQPPSQPPTLPQHPGGTFSSAPSDFASYYTADHQARNPYNYYNHNQNFGHQQGVQGQPESLGSQSQQRPFGNFGAASNDNLSQYQQGSTTAAQQAQSRFGATSAADLHNSGNTTPNPNAGPGQPPATQNNAQGQGQQAHDYPYNGHPYYSNPYYGYGGMYANAAAYNQGFGGPYGKGNIGAYGQPSQYGLAGPHGYGSSPGAFGQSSLHRDTGAVGAGLGDYPRGGSAAQAGGQQSLGGGASFGGMHDTFGRYQSQAGQGFNAPGSQPANGPAGADDLKPYGDKGAGPSPLLAAAARPGSATNAPSQGGLGPPQLAQQGGLGAMGGYSGGYPSHLQGHNLHGNQSPASGYGGAQGHQSSYGGYGQGFGGVGATANFYGSGPPRGGWANNYH